MALSSFVMTANAYLFISPRDMASILDVEGPVWGHADIIDAVIRRHPSAVGKVDQQGMPIVAQMALCVMALAASQEYQRAELMKEMTKPMRYGDTS